MYSLGTLRVQSFRKIEVYLILFSSVVSLILLFKISPQYYILHRFFFLQCVASLLLNADDHVLQIRSRSFRRDTFAMLIVVNVSFEFWIEISKSWIRVYVFMFTVLLPFCHVHFGTFSMSNCTKGNKKSLFTFSLPDDCLLFSFVHFRQWPLLPECAKNQNVL